MECTVDERTLYQQDGGIKCYTNDYTVKLLFHQLPTRHSDSGVARAFAHPEDQNEEENK